jgi:hypothetical protein
LDRAATRRIIGLARHEGEPNIHYFRRPTNDADWETELAVPARVTIAGDDISIRDIRNFAYRSRDDFTPHYESNTYKLSALQTIDMIVSYWSGALIAHVFLSFGFTDGRNVAISIEIRRRKGQKYSSLAGFFRQYEMFYVVADERDLIGQRAVARGEAVYLYRLQIPDDIKREVFLSYLARIQHLAETPEFYNTLTNNCTTNIFKHANAGERRIPFNWKILASGYVDQYAYDLGILDRSSDFQTLKMLCRISPDIALTTADYSAEIRLR